MEIIADARIVSWEGGGVWIVDVTQTKGVEPRQTDPHAHHAIQVTIGLGGTWHLESSNARFDGAAVAVAPDVQHVFRAEGLTAHVFIEPESRLGRAVTKKLFGSAKLVAIPVEALGRFPTQFGAAYRNPKRDDVALIALGKAFIAALGADEIADAPDLRVRKTIEWATQQLEGQVSLSDASSVAGLSPSRLRHLFVQNTGLPFKTFVLWLRLTRAVETFVAGASLTHAAHEAGFADSAHLSRTFRRMFGVTPAGLRIT